MDALIKIIVEYIVELMPDSKYNRIKWTLASILPNRDILSMLL